MNDKQQVSDLLSMQAQNSESLSDEEDLEFTKVKEERDRLLAEVTSLQQIKEKEEGVFKENKSKYKKIKHKFQSSVWDRVDREMNLKQLGENIRLIEQKMQEAEAAETTADSLRNMLNRLKEQLLNVTETRKMLQEQRIELESQLGQTRSQLLREFTVTSAEFEKKREATDVLQQRFNSRRNVNEVLLKLYGEVSVIKTKTQKASLSRKDFSCMAKLQVQQIKNRIELASKDSITIGEQLDENIAITTKIGKAFEDISKETLDFLSQLEAGNSISKMTDSATNILEQISDNIDTVENFIIKEHKDTFNIEELDEKVTQIGKVSREIDERQSVIVDQLKSLELFIQELKLNSRQPKIQESKAPTTQSPPKSANSRSSFRARTKSKTCNK